MAKQNISEAFTSEVAKQILDLLSKADALIPELSDDELAVLSSMMKITKKGEELTNFTINAMRAKPDYFPKTIDADSIEKDLGKYSDAEEIAAIYENSLKKIRNIGMFFGGKAYKGGRDGYKIAKDTNLKAVLGYEYDGIEKTMARKITKKKSDDSSDKTE